MKESVTYQAIMREGREEGAYLMVLQMLSIKFEELPESTLERIKQLPSSQLPKLGLAMQNFTTLADLDRWLQ